MPKEENGFSRRSFVAGSAAVALASPLFGARVGIDTALVNARMWTGLAS